MGTAFGQGWLATGRAGLMVPLWKRVVRVSTIGDTHKIGPGVKPGISETWELGQCQGRRARRERWPMRHCPWCPEQGKGAERQG